MSIGSLGPYIQQWPRFTLQSILLSLDTVGSELSLLLPRLLLGLRVNDQLGLTLQHLSCDDVTLILLTLLLWDTMTVWDRARFRLCVRVCGSKLTVTAWIQPLVVRQLHTGVVSWQLPLNPDVELLGAKGKQSLAVPRNFGSCIFSRSFDGQENLLFYVSAKYLF